MDHAINLSDQNAALITPARSSRAAFKMDSAWTCVSCSNLGSPSTGVGGVSTVSTTGCAGAGVRTDADIDAFFCAADDFDRVNKPIEVIEYRNESTISVRDDFVGRICVFLL